MNEQELLTEYERRYESYLRPVAAALEKLIRGHLDSAPHVDRISARAKRPDRFLGKALKVTPEGKPRYPDPFVQIQDLVGARVVVFYKNDVEPTEALLRKYFQPIELQDVVPDSEWTFGYFGRHFIMSLPKDAVPSDIEVDNAPRFFELQLKTLFQHAWSEAEHDLGYKSPEDLAPTHQRQLAFTSAQAWGADDVFARLVAELAPHL